MTSTGEVVRWGPDLSTDEAQELLIVSDWDRGDREALVLDSHVGLVAAVRSATSTEFALVKSGGETVLQWVDATGAIGRQRLRCISAPRRRCEFELEALESLGVLTSSQAAEVGALFLRFHDNSELTQALEDEPSLPPIVRRAAIRAASRRDQALVYGAAANAVDVIFASDGELERMRWQIREALLLDPLQIEALLAKARLARHRGGPSGVLDVLDDDGILGNLKRGGTTALQLLSCWCDAARELGRAQLIKRMGTAWRETPMHRCRQEYKDAIEEILAKALRAITDQKPAGPRRAD